MSEITLDRKAYEHNITQIANKVGGIEKIYLIAKDNSYGHGARLVCEFARELGIKKGVVRTLDEAVEIAEFFDEVLILSHIPTGNEDERFIYAVNDISNFKMLKKGLKIHIAVDTLMHRNGINPSELENALELARQGEFNLLGFYTHFRKADEFGSDFFTQRENFIEFKKIAKQKCKKFGFENVIFHSCNSAAIERSGEFSDEFVRVGIAQFGYAQFNTSLNLKPVLKLYADKISSRTLQKGERVGYGAKFEALKDMKIATYDIGYADGVFRYNGEGDLFIASGVKMLGKMSMDSFSCEDLGQKVCVIDDAKQWAKFFNTIEYEILVKLHEKIQRRWV